jgi:hypothetical protein
MMTINEEVTQDKLQNALRAVNDAMALSPHEPVQNRIAAVVEQTIESLEATEKTQTAEMYKLALRLIQTRFVLREAKAFLTGLEAYSEDSLRPIVESVLGDIKQAARVESVEEPPAPTERANEAETESEPASGTEQITEVKTEDGPPSPIQLMTYR